MPNWCENEVEITFSDRAEYERFAEIMGDPEHYIGWEPKDEMFDKFIPTPSEALGTSDWWAWRIENWGTKWNPQIEEFRLEDTGAFFRMNTAWAPPRDFFRTFSKMFPSATIELSYLEEGMSFCGKATFTNGDEHERYINNIPIEMYVAVGYQLDEDGDIDWDSDNTATLWSILEDDDKFNIYYEMETV
jgi:hypothetical protein